MILRRKPTHSAQYKAHLRSPEWAAIRKAALERAGYRCAFCGQTQDELRNKGRHLQVHHSTYVNLGHERPEDLTVLCAGRGGCHTAADRQRRLATRHIPKRRPRSQTRFLRRVRRAVVAFASLFAMLSLAPYVLPLFGNGVLVGDNCVRSDKAVRVYLSKTKYPRIVAHIKESWREGYPHVLKIHRHNADQRRERLLRRYPTREGYDRDEAPAAVLRASWKASVAYVPSGENRSAGAVLGNAIEGFCSGTRVMYVFTA